jgi:hypothetical protein
MARRKGSADAQRFGVGEWFGTLFSSMTVDERSRCVQDSKIRKREERPVCPFKLRSNGLPQPCSKESGVCSLQLFSKGEDDSVLPVTGAQGALRCTCPYRFFEGGVVQAWIGEELLGTKSPMEVSEVPFLKPDSRMTAETSLDEPSDEGSSVGRIDSVLVHPDLENLDWCAVEMQAVYFSGQALSKDFPLFVDSSLKGIPFPGKIRRPDYRSSGPKRLMPQLQIKVPTLRRWGKKMAVVIDESFFASLGKMDCVEEVSNSDIAWFVVGFDLKQTHAELVPRRVHFTTLERAVEGLTAGLPVTLDQFETEIMQRLSRKA